MRMLKLDVFFILWFPKLLTALKVSCTSPTAVTRKRYDPRDPVKVLIESLEKDSKLINVLADKQRICKSLAREELEN